VTKPSLYSVQKTTGWEDINSVCSRGEGGGIRERERTTSLWTTKKEKVGWRGKVEGFNAVKKMDQRKTEENT